MLNGQGADREAPAILALRTIRVYSHGVAAAGHEAASGKYLIRYTLDLVIVCISCHSRSFHIIKGLRRQASFGYALGVDLPTSVKGISCYIFPSRCTDFENLMKNTRTYRCWYIAKLRDILVPRYLRGRVAHASCG